MQIRTILVGFFAFLFPLSAIAQEMVCEMFPECTVGADWCVPGDAETIALSIANGGKDLTIKSPSGTSLFLKRFESFLGGQSYSLVTSDSLYYLSLRDSGFLVMTVHRLDDDPNPPHTLSAYGQCNGGEPTS